MGLTREQVDTLLRPINPRRVLKAQGQSHIAAFDVIAHLTRVFGFGGWDKEIMSLDLVHEKIVESTKNTDKGPKVTFRCWVTYRCVMRLTVRDPEGNVVTRIEDAATGSAQNMPSVGDAHDFAAKNAVSFAVKRCAKDLGDQFGLSLYNGGMTAALLGRTLVHPTDVEVGDVEEHAPAPTSLGTDERTEPVEADESRFAELTDLVKGLSTEGKAEFAAFGDAQGWPERRSEMSGDQISEAFDWLKEQSSKMTQAQTRRLFALLKDAGITDDRLRRTWATNELGREVESFKTLTEAEADFLIEAAKPKPVEGGAF